MTRNQLTRRLFAQTAFTVPLFAQRPVPEFPPVQLPPAVAALKSRRAEARPFAPAEFEARMERARQLMTDNKIDAICVAGGTTLRYFANLRWGNSERLFAYVIPRKGQPFFISPSFEEERAREQAGQDVKIWTWQEDQDPYALLGEGLRGLGLSSATIGMEEKVVFAFSDGLLSGVNYFYPSTTIISPHQRQLQP